MVLTRQQQRRQAVTNEQNASPGSDGRRPILGMADRENLDGRPRITLMLNHENSGVCPPRKSVSWSIGDHQRITGQSPMRSAEPLYTMLCITYNKVSQLEIPCNLLLQNFANLFRIPKPDILRASPEVI